MHRHPPTPPLVSPFFSPFLSQETPSGFRLETRSLISSPHVVLGCPGLIIPLITLPLLSPNTNTIPPPFHPFNISDCLSLSSALFSSSSHSACPSRPLGGQWCNHLLISHCDWQLALMCVCVGGVGGRGDGGVHRNGSPPVTAGRRLDLICTRAERGGQRVWQRNRSVFLCIGRSIVDPTCRARPGWWCHYQPGSS